jgi:hypothetical protein
MAEVTTRILRNYFTDLPPPSQQESGQRRRTGLSLSDLRIFVKLSKSCGSRRRGQGWLLSAPLSSRRQPPLPQTTKREVDCLLIFSPTSLLDWFGLEALKRCYHFRPHAAKISQAPGQRMAARLRSWLCWRPGISDLSLQELRPACPERNIIPTISFLRLTLAHHTVLSHVHCHHCL